MLTRRDAIGSIIAPLLIAGAARAQPSMRDGPPQTEGFADFSGAWKPDVEESTEIFAVEPDISTGLAELLSSIRFSSYSDLDRYFAHTAKRNYITWFNSTLAGKGEWADRRIGGVGAQANFRAFWSEFLPQHPLSLMEFLAYMAIFTNECGGNLVSVTEGFGSNDHPGIAYLFDTIRRTLPNGSTWSKRSYNTGTANRSARSLFSDPKFNTAHGSLALANVLRGSNDPVWAGDRYPRSTFSTSGQPNLTGYILEADFFKFRGRGLIQTTWRSNYLGLVEYVRAYTGNNPIVRAYQNKWAALSADDACTVSNNSDWDRLFADPAHAILCESIRQHAKLGRYLPLSTTTTGINGRLDHAGSIGCMGLRIGGGKAYAAKFKGRVREMCDALVIGQGS